MQQTSYMKRYTENRWTTRAQMNRRVSVNLDEAFAEQWAENYG
jgi:hypothetical protein